MNRMKVFGTSEKLAKSIALRAGDLTAIFQDGGLRQISYRGVEVLRGIAFLSRDARWRTYRPRVTALATEQLDRTFSLRFGAEFADDSQSMTLDARIIGQADGSLTFSVSATANTDFITNRTGFVILHPIIGLAGRSGSIGHADGNSEDFTFPDLISPGQPALNLASVTHEVAAGVIATVAMEGASFEMEDHRNWMDASYKTYSGSLFEPWPHKLQLGRVLTQKTTLTLQGKHEKRHNKRAAPITIFLSDSDDRLPLIGTSLSKDDLAKGPATRDLLKQANPGQIAFRLDLRAPDWRMDIPRLKAVLPDAGSALKLEVILTLVKTAQEELSLLADHLVETGLSPAFVAVSHQHDMASFQPDAPRPDGPSYSEMAQAARAAFPLAQIGGGMFAFFAELNRKPPPANMFDFITHAVCPTVHAADDRSVMENLEALPAIFRSARSLIGSAGYHLGASGISSRDNPYGEGPFPNTGNHRMCLADRDPRESGLFGAVWMLGLISASAQGGLVALSVGPTFGDFARDLGMATNKVTPAFHLLASLGSLGGKILLRPECDRAGIAALAVRSDRGLTLWLANMTAKPLVARIGGGVLLSDRFVAHRLDEASFDALGSASYLGSGGTVFPSGSDISLAPYSLVRLLSVSD